MRLTGWHIDTCGHLQDVGVRDLGPAMTVLVGPNEAGKTTTHYFLRGVLFGFPASQSRQARRYARQDRVAPTGRVWVSHGGRELQLDRTGTAAATLTDPSGAPVGLAAEDVTGHATRELFEAVFAVDVDDLREMGELSGDAVKERIFAASVSGGGRSARDAIKDLDERMKAIIRPRSGRLRDLRDQLRTAAAALAAAQEESRRLPSVQAEVNAAEALVTERYAELERARARADHLGRLLDYWNEWHELDSWRIEAASLPEHDLGPDPVGRLERELASLGESESALANLDLRIRTLQSDIAGCEVDERILGLAERIQHAHLQLTELSSRSRQAEENYRRLAQARSENESRCVQHLGPGWKPQHLEDIDISHPAQEKLTLANTALTTARRSEEQIRQRLDELASERDRCQRQLETAGADPRDELGLPASISLRGALADLQLLSRQLPDLHSERRSQQARANPARSAPRWLSPSMGAATVLAALATAGAAVSGQFVLAAVTGVVTVLALVACVAAAAAGGRGETGASSERVALLETRVAATAGRLGLDAEPDDETIAALAGKLPDAIAASERLGGLRDRVRDLDSEIESQQQACAEATEATRAAETAWQEAVSDCGLPPDLAPDTVSRLIAAIADLRREAERVAAEEERLDREDAYLREMAISHEQLLADAGVIDPAHDDELRLDLAARQEQIRSLAERLGTATALDQQRQAWREQLTEAEKSRPDLAGTVEAHRRALAERLEAAGVPDAASYRELAVQTQRRSELQDRIEQAEIALGASFGSGEALDTARRELSQADPQAWEREARSVEAQVAERNEQYRTAVRAEEETHRRMRELAESARVADHAATVEVLRSEAAELAHEWTTLSVARGAIDETLDYFERERQPEVVKQAAASFSRITGQRWESVFPGTKEELAVAGPSGQRLDAAKLSRGATEQLYLSMRLGLARAHAAAAEPLPLLLDDVLVNADDSRRERLADELGRVADHLQVIVFTASENTAELLARTRPDTTIVDMHAGQGTPRP